MDWTVEVDGQYRASFVAREEGFYEIGVEATANAEVIGADTTYIEVGELTTEYFGAEMQRGVLERIADETGGQFYTTESVAALPEDLGYT